VQTEDASGSRSRSVPAGTSVLRTLVVAVTVGVLLFVVGLGSRSVLGGVERHAGTSTPLSTQAFFAQPLAVQDGVFVGHQVEVGILVTRGPVRWTARSGDKVIASGLAVPQGSSATLVHIPTTHAVVHQWLTITVAGIATPLRTWLR
jgi:hypothetical protein